MAQEIGEATLLQEMRRYGLPRDLLENEGMSRVVSSFSLDDAETLYSKIGRGRIRLPEIIETIRQELFAGKSFLVKPTGEFNKINLDTLDPVFIKLSSCCKPNPAEKSNCALLTDKWLSVHNKNCPRLHQITFQREDAVDISWDRNTRITKQQSLVFPHSTRDHLMTVIGSTPEQMKMMGLTVLSNHPGEQQAWELLFEVTTLHELQRVLRHFDRSGIDYEFHLDF